MHRSLLMGYGPTCLNQTPNRTHPTRQERHTHSHKPHTPPRSDPRLNKRMKQLPARRREAKTNSIFTQQQKTKFQKFGPNNKPPVNTTPKSKRKNDKKTQKPKRNQSQKFPLPQPYWTKAHHLARSKNVSNSTKFWPTSYSSSEFGQNYTHSHFDPRQKLRSQINFPTARKWGSPTPSQYCGASKSNKMSNGCDKRENHDKHRPKKSNKAAPYTTA